MKANVVLGLLHQIQVIDKDGKIRLDTGQKHAKCWTANMAALWATIWQDRAVTPVIVNTTGLSDILTDKSNWDVQSAFINIKYPDNENAGIVLGTDDTMPTAWDNISLGGSIGNGSGVGQLTYGTMVYSDNPKIVSDGIEWTVYREFMNNSGAPITVKEIGLLSQFDSGAYALIARDLPESQVVGDGETLRVFYTIRTELGFTLQFLQLIADIWTFRSKATAIKQIDGGSTAIGSTGTWDSSYYPMSYRLSFSGSSDLDGIIVGTGDTPATLTDYALDSKIANGDGAGELVYGICNTFTASNLYEQFKDNGNAINIIYQRTLHNKSGASITIKEVGFAVNYVTTIAGKQALILRKVLDTPVTIPNNEYRTVIVWVKFPI